MAWQKGQSGNPKGRPVGTQALSTRLRELLDEKAPDGRTNREAILAKMIALALQGERWAVELLWERAEGRPPQQVKLTGADGGDVEFTFRFTGDNGADNGDA